MSKPMKREISEVFKVRRPYALKTPGTDVYKDGTVVTEYGVVGVYSGPEMTKLRLVSKGREYWLRIDRGLSWRRIVTEANSFALQLTYLRPKRGDTLR